MKLIHYVRKYFSFHEREQIERTKEILSLVLCFVACFGIAAYWQWNQTIGDPDGFYHAKIALLLREGRLLTTLPWMQFTTLRDNFADHHFLYHVLLVPFVLVKNPLLGVKLATALFGATFYTVTYWFMRRLKTPLPSVFLILLISCSAFAFRLGLIKANSVSLIMFIFILFALFNKRWILLGVLNAVYVWLYGGWLVAWLAAGVYASVSLMWYAIRPVHRKLFHTDNYTQYARGALKAFAVTIGGSGLGILVNPYFPNNLYVYWQQIWQIGIINEGGNIAVGGEWGSLAPVYLLAFFSFLVIPALVSIWFMVSATNEISFRSWCLTFLAFILVIFTAKSQRYIELSAPLVTIWFASVFADILPREQMRRAMRRLWNDSRKIYLGAMLTGFFAFIVIPNLGIWAQVAEAGRQLRSGIVFTRYEKAAHWLRDNTPEHSVVLHSDWDDWPMLFYHNHHNYYIVGLDPTFMYNYDTVLYKEWAEVTGQGKTSNVVGFMRDRVHASYAFIEKDHTQMQQLFQNNIYFRLVYEDPEVWIYELLPEEKI